MVLELTNKMNDFMKSILVFFCSMNNFCLILANAMPLIPILFKFGFWFNLKSLKYVIGLIKLIKFFLILLKVKRAVPEIMDFKLPGWGKWGGKDIKQFLKKKRQLNSKFPKKVPRKDENKGNVIIIEEYDPATKKHQIAELPFPFSSVKDYEASMRAPIGRNFVPENLYRRLIKPAVRAKLGKVIKPMDEDVLIITRPLKK